MITLHLYHSYLIGKIEQGFVGNVWRICSFVVGSCSTRLLTASLLLCVFPLSTVAGCLVAEAEVGAGAGKASGGRHVSDHAHVIGTRLIAAQVRTQIAANSCLLSPSTLTVSGLPVDTTMSAHEDYMRVPQPLSHAPRRPPFTNANTINQPAQMAAPATTTTKDQQKAP